MFNRNGNNNGHHRNGTGNGLVQSLPRTGYGGNGRIEASAPTGRRLPIKPRATRHQSSSINTGSILIPHERRSCAI